MILRTLLIGATTFGLCTAANAADGGSYKPAPSTEAAPDAPLKSKHRVKRHAPYKDCCDETYRVVYAESWYNSLKVAAPVRRGEHGDQVLLPGGPWVDCELSCEYILRKQTLSYWQHLDPREDAPSGTARPGYYIDAWGQRREYLF